MTKQPCTNTSCCCQPPRCRLLPHCCQVPSLCLTHQLPAQSPFWNSTHWLARPTHHGHPSAQTWVLAGARLQPRAGSRVPARRTGTERVAGPAPGSRLSPWNISSPEMAPQPEDYISQRPARPGRRSHLPTCYAPPAALCHRAVAQGLLGAVVPRWRSGPCPPAVSGRRSPRGERAGGEQGLTSGASGRGAVAGKPEGQVRPGPP